MGIQVLIATMNQVNLNLLEKMNIKSDAIVSNQMKNIWNREELYYNNHKIKYFTYNEVGVGLNRNNALMRATSEICLLADDDMIFEDNYVEVITSAFSNNPKADVIIFNLIENNPTRYIIKKKFKVRFYNYMRFGAARIAFRRKSITKHGITFNLHFGGGTDYSAGEDVLFLSDCLKSGLNIIALPDQIARLTNERESTWFRGFNDKYFFDKGVLFAAISKRWAKLLCLQFVIRKRELQKEYNNWLDVYKIMLKGVDEFNNLR